MCYWKKLGKINERTIYGCLEKSIRKAFWRSALIYSITKKKHSIKWKSSIMSYGRFSNIMVTCPKNVGWFGSLGTVLCEMLCLCEGAGVCGAGVSPREPDVSLYMSEQDLLAMFEGSLQPFAAYSSGRLRVQGDLNTAMKLETLINLLKNTSCDL